MNIRLNCELSCFATERRACRCVAITVACRARQVFGEVVDGFHTLGKIEAVGSKTGAVAERVLIVSCGEL